MPMLLLLLLLTKRLASVTQMLLQARASSYQ